jgi:tRNA (guanine9-N1)-methyltransferase
MYSLEQIVYLSPDSENVLTDISSDKVYVIGGIVDRSVRKSETFNKAKRLEVQTARLPLQEILHPRTHILNIDSVVMALNEYANHHDWKRAFDVAIPKRIKTHRRNEQNQS